MNSQSTVRFVTLALFSTWTGILNADMVKNQPHIIYILADDMGWNDVGFHGMRDIPTPNIDAFAANSIILNNYYTQAMCTPSRSALLTGIYPSNTGLQHYILKTASPYGLPLSLKTLPDHLKELNYVSRIVGKWHLGFYQTQYTAMQRGFDSHYGFWPGALDFFTHDTSTSIEKNQSLNVPANMTQPTIKVNGKALRDDYNHVDDKEGIYLTSLLNQKTLDIIQTHDDKKPLFLYLSHHAVHRGNIDLPVRGPQGTNEIFSYIQNNTRRNFAGVLKALDDSIGDIMEALHKKGMLKNAIVIFSSDNGASINTPDKSGGSNWPLRGQKLTPFEGGVRCNALVWYTDLQKARISDQLFHIVDWTPTLYSAAGGDPKKLGDLDGINMWNAIQNESLMPRKDALIYLDSKVNVGSMRVGNYKVISGSIQMGDTDRWYGDESSNETDNNVKGEDDSKVAQVFKTLNKDRGMDLAQMSQNKLPIELNCGQEEELCEPMKSPCLFDIVKDPCEKNNLALKEPEILKELLARLDYYKSKEVSSLDVPNDYLANPDFYDGWWSPWKDPKQKSESRKSDLSRSESKFDLKKFISSILQTSSPF